MRKSIRLTLFTACVIGSSFILSSFFPKYHAGILFLAVFLLGDMVLWLSLRSWIQGLSRWQGRTLAFLFWLPASVLFFLVFLGFLISFNSWDVTFKAILFSLLLMVIALKTPPLLIALLRRLIYILQGLRSKKGSLKLNPADKTGWALGLIIFIFLLVGMFTWIYSFRVKQVEIRSQKLPLSFDKFRVVQISDIHLGNWTCTKSLDKAVAKINLLHPDLIVFTGDMFNYSTEEGWEFIPVLKILKARYGIYAIMGNHDYGDYVSWPSDSLKQKNRDDLKLFYRTLGWNLLLNQNARLKSGNDSINIIGIENWGATRRFQKHGNIDRAEQGINKDCFSVLLSHDPSFWDSIVCRYHPEVDLTLSGHTHGGQFGIDTPGFRWSILSFSNPLWGGFYSKNKNGFNSSLYVNQGLGTVGYAGRVGIRPEITLFILHHAGKP